MNSNRITKDSGLFSILEQRLQYANSFPNRHFTNLSDNTPHWIDGYPIDSSSVSNAQSHYSCFGHEPLRGAISWSHNKRYETAINEKNILVTQGAIQGLSLIFKYLYHSSKQIFVCQSPVTGVIPKILQRLGYKVIYLKLKGDLPDFSTLRNIPWKRVAGVYLNSPANPDGQILPQSSINLFYDVCNRVSASLIIDGVYDSFVHDGSAPSLPHESLDSSKNFYFVNSMSKAYGSPALRTGWIISNESNIRSLASIQEEELSSISGICQEVATHIIEMGNESLRFSVRMGYHEALKTSKSSSLLNAHYCEGGTHILFETPVENIDDFADFALENHSLILTTTSHFEGLESKKIIRFPIGRSATFIYQSFTKLQSAVGDYLMEKQDTKKIANNAKTVNF